MVDDFEFKSGVEDSEEENMLPNLEKDKVSQEELIIEAKNFFNTQKKELGISAKKGEHVVRVNFEELSEQSPDLAERVIMKPDDTLKILEIALHEGDIIQNARIRFTNLSKTQQLKIRNIRAKNLNNMIAIEGIVRQASEVRPRVVNARFECPACGTIHSVLQIDEKFREPSRCSCGRRGGFRELEKEMVDAQRLVLEESSDNLSGGEQPKRINVFLKEDLVEPRMEEKTTPGSKVSVIGVLKEVPIPHKTGGIMTRFELSVEANNITPMEESFDDIKISEEDEDEIKELASDPRVVEKLAESIAPSVWGYPEIKQSLTLQLFGGVQKRRSDGTQTRGDIHILLVGDPGVAKSVMLKFISGIAPKGRYVSGKSASAAGLTASVVKDEFMRGWALEAGAMVLSNKGLVCIDELEKMDENDRSAMHEALEQQTVTISKATVQATLRAQTSVLAAANPKFGRFDPHEVIAKQVNLVPSLLNRFDVLFILRDLPNLIRDESIAAHVLQEHKQGVHRDIIEKDLLRKYISYARQKCHPALSDEAIKKIKTFYVSLRNQPIAGGGDVRPIPISARQLEALIRLAEATAKTRLAKTVTADDAQKAIDLMKYYMMQVGYDEETKSFDIDKISGNPASKRNKIYIVKELLEDLESRLGKLIPMEEIEKMAEGKISASELEEAMDKLVRAGDLFRPRKGYVQRM
ncbi:minichromosome maintenance protein MCM [Candidatus Pacearchaeota archaeon]|nr:minichromosome maintenance protein MCM [Candidatus Pacearchaeota archaeon]